MRFARLFAPAAALAATLTIIGCDQFVGFDSNPVTPMAGSIALVPADGDADGVIDSTDNCPDAFNGNQADADTDTIGDVCDNCACVANSDQLVDPCAEPAITLTDVTSLPDHSATIRVLVTHSWFNDQVRWRSSDGGFAITTVSGFRNLRPCWETGWEHTFPRAGTYDVTLQVGSMEETFRVTVD